MHRKAPVTSCRCWGGHPAAGFLPNLCGPGSDLERNRDVLWAVMFLSVDYPGPAANAVRVAVDDVAIHVRGRILKLYHAPRFEAIEPTASGGLLPATLPVARLRFISGGGRPLPPGSTDCLQS